MTQTIEQFGQTVKAKHPEYSDMSDADVGTKVLAKYPQYNDMVTPTSPSTGGVINNSLNMAKTLVTAPATMVARPIQAATALMTGGYGNLNTQTNKSDELRANLDAVMNNYYAAKNRGDTVAMKQYLEQSKLPSKLLQDQLDTGLNPALAKANASDANINKVNLGGIIAPTPQNMADVKKDVGRGIQTVALGIEGAPLTTGAAFGFGSSLEQGNNVFSMATLENTLLGMGMSKALDLVGKPILDFTGKVVGAITPQMLKDVASKGSLAVKDFMAQHEIAGGALKPLTEKINAGANAIDTGINKGASSLWSGTKDIAKSQYPNLTKENLQEHYVNVEKKNFAEPAIKNEAGYKKAKGIYDNAKANGTDLAQVAVDNGITHDSILEGKKFNTLDTADNIRTDAMQTSHDLMRPALAAAENSVSRVPLADLQSEMLSNIDKIPKSQITDLERAQMKAKVNAEYGAGSPADIAHPNGYSLTDLHDGKINTSLKAKHNPLGTIADNLTAQTNDEASGVFKRVLEKKAPPELKVKDFNAELTKKFQLADYLESLHGKKAPQTLAQKSVNLFGKMTGAGFGNSLVGGYGGFAGYHLGGILVDSFQNMSNPIKAAVLRDLELSKPVIFQAFKDYFGDAEIARMLRTTKFALPSGNKTDINLQKVKNASGAIEMPAAPTNPANTVGNDMFLNQQSRMNTKALPAAEPRIILPNNQGTPNIFNRPYAPNEQGAVGGFGQKLNQEQFDNLTREEILKRNNALQNSRIFQGNSETPKITDAEWKPTKKLKDVYDTAKQEQIMKDDYFKEKIKETQATLDSHPGKKLQKFISTKEGQFQDFKNPNLAKTPSEKAKIKARNEKLMRASESAFEGTPFADQYDNPDIINQAIEEYKTLKDNLDKLKNAI